MFGGQSLVVHIILGWNFTLLLCAFMVELPALYCFVLFPFSSHRLARFGCGQSRFSSCFFARSRSRCFMLHYSALCYLRFPSSICGQCGFHCFTFTRILAFVVVVALCACASIQRVFLLQNNLSLNIINSALKF